MDTSSSGSPIFVGTVVRFRGIHIRCLQLDNTKYPRQFIRPLLRDSRLQVCQRVCFRIKDGRAVQIQLTNSEPPLPTRATT